VDLLDLLDVLRGDHATQRGAHVRRQHDAVLGSQADGRRPGLHLAFAGRLGTALVGVGELPELGPEHGFVAADGVEVREVTRWSHYRSVGRRR